MLAKVLSYGLSGIDGFPVLVEADIQAGLSKFDIVGLADTAVKESKDRVRAAIKNSGFEYPIDAVTVNLAPADKKKEGPMYDLPIAVSLLVASGKVDFNKIKDVVFLGELSLDGTIKKINGVLPILISARNLGYKNFVIPAENEIEASFIGGINVGVASTLKDLGDYFMGNNQMGIKKVKVNDFDVIKQQASQDVIDIKNKSEAKRS